ncbi:hypothetical protein [Nocardioides zeae]
MIENRLVDRMIWATRGHSWVFRFLLDAGLPDPLPSYERAFGALQDQPKAWRREGSGLALRFPDPEGRRDVSGRVIPHEFVIWGDMVDTVESPSQGQELVWPLVDEVFASTWDMPSPPPPLYLDVADAKVRER